LEEELGDLFVLLVALGGMLVWREFRGRSGG
jgi:hypothetical protein